MRVSGRLIRRSLFVTLLVLVLLVPAVLVSAAGHLPPVPITIPRDPAPIPHSDVIKPYWTYNNVIVPNLPAQSSEAASVASRDGVDSSDPGILKKITNIANGTTLSYHNAPDPSPCVDFNANGQWASRIWTQGKWQGETWGDWFAGWGPFAVDDGFYQAKNVVFSKENVVGPGENYSDKGPKSRTDGDGSDTGGKHSMKIASSQPYAAGLASPIIDVAPGSEVKVVVRYLIFNHGNINDDSQWAYDWASLGVKPDAYGDAAQYVNGYTRGEWAVMENTITAGDSGQVMVLLQAHSPAALNSNIYFDDVEIFVNGTALSDCRY